MKNEIRIFSIILCAFLIMWFGIPSLLDKVGNSQSEVVLREMPPTKIPSEIIIYNVSDEVKSKIPIEYNLTKVKEEVINEMKSYFGGVDFYDFEIINDKSLVWDGSFYSDSERRIVMGLMGVENDEAKYRLVLTHEYMHYILYRQGLDNPNAHESIADVYTRYTNLKESKGVFGDVNEERYHPYSIISNKLIKESEEDCLKEVFNPNDKIGDFDELVERLNYECDVSYVYLINNYYFSF